LRLFIVAPLGKLFRLGSLLGATGAYSFKIGAFSDNVTRHANVDANRLSV